MIPAEALKWGKLAFDIIKANWKGTEYTDRNAINALNAQIIPVLWKTCIPHVENPPRNFWHSRQSHDEEGNAWNYADWIILNELSKTADRELALATGYEIIKQFLTTGSGISFDIRDFRGLHFPDGPQNFFEFQSKLKEYTKRTTTILGPTGLVLPLRNLSQLANTATTLFEFFGNAALAKGAFTAIYPDGFTWPKTFGDTPETILDDFEVYTEYFTLQPKKEESNILTAALSIAAALS